MKIFKAIAGISAIFILGALTGALGTSLVVKHRIETLHEKGPPPIKPILMDRLSRHLKLSPEQKIAVAKILEETQQALGELRQNYKPRMREIFSDCSSRIQAQLSPIQQKRFRQIEEKFPRMMPHKPFKRGLHHGPPPPESRQPSPE